MVLLPSLIKMLFEFVHVAATVKTGFIMLGIEEEFCNSPQRRSVEFVSFPLTMGIDGTLPHWGPRGD